jgi:hypothetical protein
MPPYFSDVGLIFGEKGNDYWQKKPPVVLTGGYEIVH